MVKKVGPDKELISCSNEDDWTKIANKTKETIKSFDYLFNDNKNDDNIFCGLFSFQRLDVEHRNIDKLNHVTLKGRQK